MPIKSVMQQKSNTSKYNTFSTVVASLAGIFVRVVTRRRWGSGSAQPHIRVASNHVLHSAYVTEYILNAVR